MKHTPTIFSCCLILSLASASLAQQTPGAKERLPSVDEILATYVKALGGKQAIEKVKSRTSKGTMEIEAIGASAPIEVLMKAPNKRFSIVDFPNIGQFLEGFNGTVAWSKNPQVGLVDKTGKELAHIKRESDLHREIRFKELYPKQSVKGTEQVQGQDAYVIEAEADPGSPEKFYFSKKTGLLVRHDRRSETELGEAELQIQFEDYRSVDGVQQAFSMRIIAGPEVSFLIKLTEVKHNVTVDDAKFEKPAK